ncbi:MULTISPECIES: hypothetical protein [Streptomyces]|uniref:Uncharacterized protein n=1 Tax=Streptomyces flavovirens TaxID=52258 RepID=A0ABV8ND71_9ACTN|nr:hypothetical protein [Streptomyces sp. MBT51]MBK3596268.1 hypothetical protein [Streptomyces sp. MBT51]
MGETVPGCYLPPRTPRRADEVRDAISRAFDIPTTHTADPPEQDTFAGHQLEHGEQSFIIVTRYQKALRLLAEAYVEQEQLLLQVQGLSGELVAARGQARAWQEKHLELAERCTVAVCGASAVAGGGGA